MTKFKKILYSEFKVFVECKITIWRYKTALFWVVTQRVVVIYYGRFGTTYRSHQNLDP